MTILFKHFTCFSSRVGVQFFLYQLLLLIATEKMVHHNMDWRTLMWTTLMTTLTKISNGNKTIHPLRGSIQTNHIRESWTIQPRHLVVARDPKCHRDLTGVFSNLQSRKREDGKCNLKVMLCTELEKFCIFNLCCEMVTHY